MTTATAKDTTMTTTNTDPTTMTPAQVDQAIAAIDLQIMRLRGDLTTRTNMVRSSAGMRDYDRRLHRYVNTGTWNEAVAEVTRRIELGAAERAANAARAENDAYVLTPNAISPWNAEQPLRFIAEATAMKAEIDRLITVERAPLHAEFAARRWSRFFLVVSSSGHIHSSAGGCTTCYPATQYGWLPEMSGLTEAEAMDYLDEQPGASRETLCSVCFPDAPVAGKRQHITKAKAAKLAASVVDSGDAE